MTTAIWWVRRDLRLSDNQALAAAMAVAKIVLPVFVLDPALLSSPYVSDRRLSFMFEGLRLLDSALTSRGSRLIVRRGDPAEVLAALAAESGAGTIFAEEDHSSYARQRDRAVSERVSLRLVGGVTVHPPAAVVKQDGSPYTLFSPYSRTWLALPPPGASGLLPAPTRIYTPESPIGEPMPASSQSARFVDFPAGEVEAQRRLADFVGQPPGRASWERDAGVSAAPPVYEYAQARNRLDLPGTSRLSPYLRFGMLSAREAVVAAQRAIAAAPDASARESAATWLKELIWREFYTAILAQFPQVREHAFRAELRAVTWLNDGHCFDAWCAGSTGYPVVDAAMRELAATGWMHNRARMIVASFLVKDLLIDWRWGERWFMQHLVDGDPASNNGGWQWTAGTGTDVAPYFRIFNPIGQGLRCDPKGGAVKRWVPELAKVPLEYIHEPWRMPVEIQRSAGCVIGRDYPAPLVDHGAARRRTLAAYAAARSAG